MNIIAQIGEESEENLPSPHHLHRPHAHERGEEGIGRVWGSLQGFLYGSSMVPVWILYGHTGSIQDAYRMHTGSSGELPLFFVWFVSIA